MKGLRNLIRDLADRSRMRPGVHNRLVHWAHAPEFGAGARITPANAYRTESVCINSSLSERDSPARLITSSSAWLEVRRFGGG